MPSNPKLTFHNHASVSITYRNRTLLTDPWFSGSAFNRGWRLLEETDGNASRLKGQTSIFISHEHPDHFSVPYFRSIPVNQREKVTVFFQRTRDRRVSAYLRSNGFEVVELEKDREYAFGDDFSLSITPVPIYDSYLLVRVGGRTILNLNDCVIERPSVLRKIGNQVGNLDILLTQFSYANWIPGGPFDPSRRVEEARKKVDRLRVQVEVLNPKLVIPFASMVRFSHIENYYLNDSVVKPSDVLASLENHGSVCRFLAPGEEVNLNELETLGTAESHEGYHFWETRFKSLNVLPLEDLEGSKSFDELAVGAGLGIRAIKESASPALFLLFRLMRLSSSIVFEIRDLGIVAEFCLIKGLTKSPTSPGAQRKNDLDRVRISSESLFHLVSTEFGMDTLSVNGRFEASDKMKKRMTLMFAPQVIRNAGFPLTFVGVIKFIWARRDLHGFFRVF